MAKFKILFIIFLLLSFKSFSQTLSDTAKISSEFNEALNLYNSFRFDEAQKIFDKIAAKYEYNPQTTIAYLFAGKSLFKLKKYDEAEKTLKKFLSKYSGSKYADEARLTLADISFQQKNYYVSLKELSSLIDSTNSSFYESYAKSAGEKMALNYLSSSQILTLYDSLSVNNSNSFILFLLGKSYLQDGDLKDAENTFSTFLKRYPESEEKSEVEDLSKQATGEKQNTVSTPVIAAMLPLTGAENSNESRIASEILEGIKFAVSEYNITHGKKIGLIIRNTERNINRINKIKNELMNLTSLKAIIGPVYSDEVRAALEAFKGTDIPIISPTATDDSLTNLYSNFFQANPSFIIRGKVIAEYIYYVENKRRMAVLNAEEGYSPIIADAFIKEFESLGGEIIIRQLYNSNNNSFSAQIAAIAADSSKLDGVYLPIVNSQDVPAILSQFVLYNFNLPIYGNQDWFLAKGFETYPTLSNKLTFTSDYFFDYADTAFQIFSKKFLDQTNVSANRNVLYGYDAAEYLLKAVKNFNVDLVSLKNELVSEFVYKGYHNNIYFDSERVNKFLNIVRYKDGKFELVDKFKLSR